MAASAADFALGSVALAASALAYNRGETGRSLAYGGAAMLVFTAANVSECKR